MKKIVFYILTSIFFSWAASAAAMEIAWMYVQHRQYVDAEDVNRLGFGLVDEEMRYLRGDDKIAQISLYGPDGQPVKLAPPEFGEVEEIYGRYDSKNSRWHYSSDWEYDSWFSADILAPLLAGQYRLQVSTTEGKTAERTYAFIRPIKLPAVAVGPLVSELLEPQPTTPAAASATAARPSTRPIMPERDRGGWSCRVRDRGRPGQAHPT